VDASVNVDLNSVCAQVHVHDVGVIHVYPDSATFQDRDYSRPPRVGLMIWLESTTFTVNGSFGDEKGVDLDDRLTPPHVMYYPWITFKTYFTLCGCLERVF
jgi:hypothetical protein